MFTHVNKAQAWRPKLRIAMQLNRTDFALENILGEGNWTSAEMLPFVKSCLFSNKVNFLRVLNDTGFTYYSLATPEILSELFTTEVHKNVSPSRGGLVGFLIIISYIDFVLFCSHCLPYDV